MKYNCLDKVIITSFEFEYLRRMREVSSEIRLGYLTDRTDEGLIDELGGLSDAIGELKEMIKESKKD